MDGQDSRRTARRLWNDFTAHAAPAEFSRTDPIGGCEGLILAEPPKQSSKRRQADWRSGGRDDRYRTGAKPAKAKPAKGARPADVVPGM